MLINDDFFDIRPQGLCKMCGMCCKLATTSVSYEQLQAEVKEGLQSSIDFLSIFHKYESYEDAYKINPKHVENVTEAMREVYGPNFVPEFYYCNHLNPDNTCGIYEKRPLVCKRAPASPWMLMAPECGYNDWLAEQRMKHVNYIRNLKETIKLLQNYPPDYFIQSKNKKAGELIQEFSFIIDAYKKYGADEW